MGYTGRFIYEVIGVLNKGGFGGVIWLQPTSSGLTDEWGE